MDSRKMRIVIVGGVAGGMSAATRARRMNEAAEIIVLERGGFISFANCGLPYHVAGRIAQEAKLLVTTPEKVASRYRIDARVHQEVVAIDRKARTVRVKKVLTGEVEELAYDKLILAMGASAIVPAMEGLRAENVFTMRSMEDVRGVQAYLGGVAGQRAVVVGAGFIGLEMAEALVDRGMKVTVVEKAPQVLPPLDPEIAVDIAEELKAHGVTVITGNGIAGVSTSGGRVTGVRLDDGGEVPADVVILSIGVRPNTELARAAGVAIGASGAISVNAHQQTSDADVYAVGDVAEVTHGVTGRAARVPLAGPANRHGRIAGEHAATGASVTPSPRVMGTAIVQVFGLAAGLTGLGERAAMAAGYAVETAYVTANDHAGYYPGAVPVRMKLMYDGQSGRVLGAQATGRAGVDKRLDVIATLMHFGGTVADLSSLDLAYAPQFGSAKDVLHMAGFVAENQRTGVTPAIAPREIDGRQLVDVRTAEEFARGHLDNAVNMPVDTLRGHMAELDRKRPTAVMCQGGLRGHVAARMLRQSGFADVVNVKGGWELARRGG